MKTDALKKHHFWIIAGLAPVLVLVSIALLSLRVSGAITQAQTATEGKLKTVKSGNAPGKGVLDDIEKKKLKLEEIRGQLWKKNWDQQAVIYQWPKTPNNAFDKFNDLKFGTEFNDFIRGNLIESFRPAYRREFDKLGELIAPTKYKGDWKSVLRWVERWGEKAPESKQLWIAMEDLWIQRALLEPLKDVNERLTKFELYAPNGQKPPPLKRTFYNRVWQVDLEVAQGQVDQNQAAGRILKGRLTNRTNQLQILGAGSAMILKVWFEPKLELPPYEFRIEGAGVPGKDVNEQAPPAGQLPKNVLEIPLIPSHRIPANIETLEIAKIEQVLDDRTVPIRRLDRLALGYNCAKDAAKELVPGTYWPEDPVVEAPAGAAGPGGGEGMPIPGAGRGGPGMGGLGGMAGAAAQMPGVAGGLRLFDVANNNKKRYVEVTSQLRRMPVAFIVVLDQMYVNDLLVSYSNSPMRFETTQLHWKRFLEPLGTSLSSQGGEFGPGGEGNGEVAGAAGSFGGSFGSMGGFPGMPGAGGLGLPGGEGSEGGGQFGIPGLEPGALSSVSDAQANSGLIQLTVYGLITLYEKHEVPKKEGDAAPMGETAPADPMTPADPNAPMEQKKAAETPMEPKKPADAPQEPTKK